MEKFQYRPILFPGEIRMLEILPGEAEEPIQVKIFHKYLSDMPESTALSYEWGSPTRDATILCEGKVLNVTPNLVAALRRLRRRGSDMTIEHVATGMFHRLKHKLQKKKASSRFVFDPSKIHLLWIDAICINQDDIEERSQQVSLMERIYTDTGRVIVWLGEEMPDTKEACDLMSNLARQARPLLQDGDSWSDLPHSVIVTIQNMLTSGGTKFWDIKDQPVYSAIMDLFASRTVFNRLWTTQEISLAPSKRTFILCGSVFLAWEKFYFIFTLLTEVNHRSFHPTAESATIFMNIIARETLRTAMRSKRPLLGVLLITSQSRVTDPRDRIFGILGLLDDPTRLKLSHLSYHDSLGYISRKVTELILDEDGTLDYLVSRRLTNNWVAESKQPNWVLVEMENLANLIKYHRIDELSAFKVKTKISIAGNTLFTSGLVVDTVSSAYPNFSSKNWEKLFLAIHYDLKSEQQPRAHFPREINDRLRSFFFSSAPNEKSRLDYDHLAAWVTFHEYEQFHNQHLDAQDHLGPGNQNGQTFNHATMGAIDPIGNNDTPNQQYWRGQRISDLYERASKWKDVTEPDLEPLFRRLILQEVKTTADHDNDTLHATDRTPNVFTTVNGYIGIGPSDDVADSDNPTVQVGDVIALFPQVSNPLVLRPCGTGEYIFVGPAFIPYIEEDPLLLPENCPPFTEIRII